MQPVRASARTSDASRFMTIPTFHSPEPVTSLCVTHNDIEFSGERKRVRCNEGLGRVPRCGENAAKPRHERPHLTAVLPRPGRPAGQTYAVPLHGLRAGKTTEVVAAVASAQMAELKT